MHRSLSHVALLFQIAVVKPDRELEFRKDHEVGRCENADGVVLRSISLQKYRWTPNLETECRKNAMLCFDAAAFTTFAARGSADGQCLVHGRNGYPKCQLGKEWAEMFGDTGRGDAVRADGYGFGMYKCYLPVTTTTTTPRPTCSSSFSCPDGLEPKANAADNFELDASTCCQEITCPAHSTYTNSSTGCVCDDGYDGEADDSGEEKRGTCYRTLAIATAVVAAGAASASGYDQRGSSRKKGKWKNLQWSTMDGTYTSRGQNFKITVRNRKWMVDGPRLLFRFLTLGAAPLPPDRSITICQVGSFVQKACLIPFAWDVIKIIRRKTPDDIDLDSRSEEVDQSGKKCKCGSAWIAGEHPRTWDNSNLCKEAWNNQSNTGDQAENYLRVASPFARKIDTNYALFAIPSGKTQTGGATSIMPGEPHKGSPRRSNVMVLTRDAPFYDPRKLIREKSTTGASIFLAIMSMALKQTTLSAAFAWAALTSFCVNTLLQAILVNFESVFFYGVFLLIMKRKPKDDEDISAAFVSRIAFIVFPRCIMWYAVSELPDENVQDQLRVYLALDCLSAFFTIIDQILTMFIARGCCSDGCLVDMFSFLHYLLSRLVPLLCTYTLVNVGILFKDDRCEFVSFATVVLLYANKRSENYTEARHCRDKFAPDPTESETDNRAAISKDWQKLGSFMTRKERLKRVWSSLPIFSLEEINKRSAMKRVFNEADPKDDPGCFKSCMRTMTCGLLGLFVTSGLHAMSVEDFVEAMKTEVKKIQASEEISISELLQLQILGESSSSPDPITVEEA